MNKMIIWLKYVKKDSNSNIRYNILTYKVHCVDNSKITLNKKEKKCKPLNHDEIISSLNKK